mmetsp:Transcript_21649/g.74353  ORF Transcript_21649/g.74353 Transcript_21649/m.74353 type:complete len:135 (+) Transcript_21649:783-1187(+)
MPHPRVRTSDSAVELPQAMLPAVAVVVVAVAPAPGAATMTKAEALQLSDRPLAARRPRRVTIPLPSAAAALRTVPQVGPEGAEWAVARRAANRRSSSGDGDRKGPEPMRVFIFREPPGASGEAGCGRTPKYSWV